MKILVVCQYYYPENFQITPICETMAKRGHDVTVLTGLPNYPTGFITPGYERGHRDEFVNGVHVIRVKEHPRKKGILHLALNYLSYWKRAGSKIFKLKNEFDCVFLYQLSPIFMGLPAVKYKKTRGIPLLTYVCDIWPESLKMYLKNEESFVYKYVRKVSYNVYSNSDKLVCQSRSFIDYLDKYHHIKKDKISYIPAFADESYLEQDFSLENGVVDFVFLGNLGIAQNLFKVLEAVLLIKNMPGFKVHFVGEGACLGELKTFVESNNLNEKVVFHGRRDVSEMVDFYKIADVCMVSLKADNSVGLTLPSKVQGYMAAGKPILGMIEGSAETVIKEAACGFCAKSDDVLTFSNLMKDIIDGKYDLKKLGQNGRVYFVNNFRQEKCIARIENELRLLIKKER